MVRNGYLMVHEGYVMARNDYVMVRNRYRGGGNGDVMVHNGCSRGAEWVCDGAGLRCDSNVWMGCVYLCFNTWNIEKHIGKWNADDADWAD